MRCHRFGLILLLILPLIACAEATAPSDTPRTLTVQGRGEVRAQPDIIHLRAEIQHTADSAEAARQQVAAVMAQVQQVAQRQGIAAEDLDASQFFSQPQYDWVDGERRYRGEQVRRPLTLTLREPTRYSALVKDLVQAGVNAMRGAELAFSDRAALEQQALQQAFADAAAKAAVLAASAEARLGQVQAVRERGDQGGPQPLRAMAAREADGGMQLGTQTLSATVEVVFTLR